ncbi:acyl-CoA reductase [Shinella zoogloeoides]|uniref:acyl-CoA reductase n=1 Tax=Shinella zoogloeoides TaxID=352475 RepID=UPI00299F3778|nr:acyl-CoA reductase [Shinella zoogloeoides]WPE19140.1 hypothetical protein ShzoTeo12_02970 [Shinella zoogloeoides]
MTDVQVLGTKGSIREISEANFVKDLDKRIRHRTVLPFSDDRLAAVAAVSAKLLEKRASLPAFVTHFAFWTRKSALQRLKESYLRRMPETTQARARGLVFHLPPQNVETVFLYSWILSYLVGNANVVRLPSTISSAMQSVCDLFLEELATQADETQLFVRYDAASEISAGISSCSDARVVWGGDAKVDLFASLPLRKGGKALWFGDRFSWALFKGEALAVLTPQECHVLAQRFANDIAVFDQMACASPHTLYVVGDAAAHSETVRAFLADLGRSIREKQPPAAAGLAIRKMTEAFALASTGEVSSVLWQDDAVTGVFAEGTGRRELRVGGGFLQVVFLPSTDDIPSLIEEYDQAVVHFGFSSTELNAMAASHIGQGVSRWCPAGTALDFDFIWDGYDIPFELSRFVRVS